MPCTILKTERCGLVHPALPCLHSSSLTFSAPLFLIPLLPPDYSFSCLSIYILPEKANPSPTSSISPNLLPYSWVTVANLLNFAVHTSLRYLKPKLTAPLPPIFSLLVQVTVTCPGTQLRNINLQLHSFPPSANVWPSEPHCFWLGHLQFVPKLFTVSSTYPPPYTGAVFRNKYCILLLLLFKLKIFSGSKCLHDKVQSLYLGI